MMPPKYCVGSMSMLLRIAAFSARVKLEPHSETTMISARMVSNFLWKVQDRRTYSWFVRRKKCAMSSVEIDCECERQSEETRILCNGKSVIIMVSVAMA